MTAVAIARHTRVTFDANVVESRERRDRSCPSCAAPCRDPRLHAFGSVIPKHALLTVQYSCTQSIVPHTVPRTMAAILPLHLPDHLHTLFISTVGFAAVHHLAAPEFARFLLGKKGWDALGSRERVGWCVFVFRLPVCTPSLLFLLLCAGWIAC